MRPGLAGLRSESGQTTIAVAFGMVVIIAFMGLVVDIGNLRYSRRNLQIAADAAAVAAGLEVHQCGTTLGCTAMVNAATSVLAENGYTNVAVGTNCTAPASSGSVTLILNTPPCALGASDPNSGKDSFVEVQVTQAIPTYFSRAVGVNNVTVGARAEASRPIVEPCIWALDKTRAGAISMVAALGVNSNCGIVDESSSSSAFNCVIGLAITAPSIAVHGGASGLLCSASNVHTGATVPTPADPLAYLAQPTVGACGAKSGGQYYGSASAVNILLGGTYVFHPGVYCGGISITAALLANITFNPGTYILTDGPGLLGVTQGGLTITLSALSNIQATGVTFYNTGTVGSISITAPAALGLSNFNMSAPTSGTYSGVLFFQDPADTATGTFLVSLAQGSTMDGAIYLPSATVSYGVGAISSTYTILVAKDINFNVAVLSTFGNDYSSLSNGSPLDANLAYLVQ